MTKQEEEKEFKKCENKERLAFYSIRKFLTNKEDKIYKIYYTSKGDDYTGYDILLHIYTNGEITSSNIIEIKVRDTHFTDLILEQKKYDKLKILKQREEENGIENVNIYYLNFTPKGTYMYNLTKMDIEWFGQYFPDNSVNTKKEIYKTITFLHTNDGIDIPYIFDMKKDIKYMKKLKEIIQQQEIDERIFQSKNTLK